MRHLDRSAAEDLPPHAAGVGGALEGGEGEVCPQRGQHGREQRGWVGRRIGVVGRVVVPDGQDGRGGVTHRHGHCFWISRLVRRLSVKNVDDELMMTRNVMQKELDTRPWFGKMFLENSGKR